MLVKTFQALSLSLDAGALQVELLPENCETEILTYPEVKKSELGRSWMPAAFDPRESPVRM